jgi:hypothetical protein
MAPFNIGDMVVSKVTGANYIVKDVSETHDTIKINDYENGQPGNWWNSNRFKLVTKPVNTEALVTELSHSSGEYQNGLRLAAELLGFKVTKKTIWEVVKNESFQKR